MADEPVSFEKLVDYRQELRQFCSAHYNSLVAFRDGISFKLTLAEPKLGREAEHLTSTATCIESLLDCPEAFLPRAPIDIDRLANDFSKSAMRRPHDGWRSDDVARIYCRCRTLPLIIYHISSYQSKIQQHLERILYQLKHDNSRLALGEAAVEDPKPEDWYRPHAFHTYWFLYLLHALRDRFPQNFDTIQASLAGGRFDFARIREEMLMWAQRTAGYQSGLHASKSVKLDSDQLAWSIAILIKFGRDFQSDLGQQDFVRYALGCLFAVQNDAGIWRTGAPLFHYPHSGNAFCYIYETFTVLLKGALTDRKEGLFLRRTLLRYVERLIRLWRYATATQIPLSDDGKQIAWSSGHRVNHAEPESWATASVFAFAQSLRRLVGIWAREVAAKRLDVLTSHGSAQGAVTKLADRGNTWSLGRSKTAATQLLTLFVNPFYVFQPEDPLEPDSTPINERHARGAILFGPPGTSKTTLARSIADAIGWDYVELHASDFVAEGLPHVQRRADEIFGELMQLDRTVILFDEIDELVRARKMGNDAFGRFLTTSMLPKLAELWTARKVMYFVATNHIRLFDPAVMRAQRFDAVVHVSPPGFKRKIDQITKLMKFDNATRLTAVKFTRRDVEKALNAVVKAPSGSTAPLSDKDVLAKLLLVRWDQLQEVVSTIKRRKPNQNKITWTRQLAEHALAELSDPILATCEPYKEFVRSASYERRDFSKVVVWRVRGTVPAKCKKHITSSGYYVSNAGFGDFSGLPCKCTVLYPDSIKLR
jgi:hypothetical protein